MIAKLFEVRDRGTFMPVLAVQLLPSNEADRYLLGRSGYTLLAETQANYVVLSKIDGGEDRHMNYDPYAWKTETLRQAHRYISSKFGDLESGSVIDVEFITGRTTELKISERLTSRVA